MAFALARRAALGWLVLASACGSSNDESTASPSNSDDAGAIVGTNTSAITFAFGPHCADGAGMCAAPSQSQTIAIGAPFASVTVGLEGAYADASLDANSVALASGVGTVSLHTSSVPTTFRLVARNATDPTVSSALMVAVSASGFATLRALPSYQGERAATEFLATAVVSSTCLALTATPPSDDAPWTLAPATIPIQLTVPAGEPLAIDVRVGHYAYGCADLTPLGASASLEETIDVYDLPIALAQTDLDATFDITAGSPTAWKAALDAAGATVTAGFFAASDQADALLDGVRATIAATADQTQFDQLRTTKGWDATTTTWLTAHAPSIHARAAAWMTASDLTPMGPVILHLAAGTTTGTAVVTPSSFGTLSAASAAIAPPAPFAWTADSDDTVHLQGAIDLAATPLVAHLGDALAVQAISGATDTPSAIAIAIDGPGLAASLVGSGVLYGQCAASCAANAIRAAIAAAWTTASAAATGGADDVHFALTASAPASVGDYAQPTEFSGGWQGMVSGTGTPTAFSTKGTVSATLPTSIQ